MIGLFLTKNNITYFYSFVNSIAGFSNNLTKASNKKNVRKFNKTLKYNNLIKCSEIPKHNSK